MTQSDGYVGDEFCDQCNEAVVFCGCNILSNMETQVLKSELGKEDPFVSMDPFVSPTPTLGIFAKESDHDASLYDGFKRPVSFTNEYVSVSRLKLYEQCPRAFFFRYVVKADKIPPDGDAPNVYGSVLHEVLETIYQWAMIEEFTGTIGDHVILEHLHRAWERHDPGRGNLSGLGAYDYCLKRLRRYFRGRTVDSSTILGVEKEIEANDPRVIEAFGGVKVNGYIDRVERRSGDRVAIIDYKNGFMLFSEEELKNDLQMSIYDVVARIFWPWAKEVILEFHMIRHDDAVQESVRTDSDRENVRRYLPMLSRMTETDQDYPAKINKNCGYCDYRNKCSVYAKMVTENDDRVHVDAGNAEEVLLRYKRTNDIAKNAKTRAEKLKDLVLQHIVATPGQVAEAGGYLFSTRRNANNEYTAADVVELLQQAGIPLPRILQAMNVTSSGIESLLDEVKDPNARTMLDMDLRTVRKDGLTKPYIQITKKKG